MRSSSNHLTSGSSNFRMDIPIVTLSGSDTFLASSDATLFSSSLPVLPHKQLNPNVSENCHQSVDDITSGLNKSNGGINNLLDDGNLHAIGNFLPDDEEELLAGITDGLDLSGLPNALEDMEEFFGSSGGMELETDPQESLNKGFQKMSVPDAIVENSMPQYSFQNGAGTVAGEHPYGEHPSRTLFVRNINSNVGDSELRVLFEQYGDIRTLYTACKHRGFVMISYFDIRSARTAMRALQNKPLRRRKLDIHFSIPKDNPSEKDINQGTLVVFNLDPSVSNEDLEKIFGAYGEVKEIRETPHKRHHKFVEFFDVRSAEAALKALNRSDIAGKRIKLEPSRPGGARRNLMLQLNQELEQDDSRGYMHHSGSPLVSSSTGNWLNSPIENTLQSIGKSPVFGNLTTKSGHHFSGLSSILHSQSSNLAKAASVKNDQGRMVGRFENMFSSNNNSGHGTSLFHQPQSFTELSHYHGTVSAFGSSNSSAARVETLPGSQFLWGSSSSSVWPSSYLKNPFSSKGKAPRFPFSAQNGSLQHHHHIGSAPSGFYPSSPETSFVGSAAFGGAGSNTNPGIGVARNISETGSPSFRMMSSPRHSHLFVANSSYPRPMSNAAIDGLLDHGRVGRVDTNMNEVDSKRQFQLDLAKIISGEDTRTTLMIKNIPNKYTSKMLLAAIDEKNRGTYDFLYLPIDFKNKCNVGYAFINMLSPKHIISFYEAFNGKRWDKFNSEKVASLAYARIQGKSALVAHFQNSSLMNEDKRCRPIVFDEPESGEPIILEHSHSSTISIPVPHPNALQSVNSPESPSKDATSQNIQQN